MANKKPNNKNKHVSGFVSLIGRPNAGKSTLLNALVGAKVAIVAAKPQTTRTAVQAVWNAPGAQIVFLDTPGIHRSDTLFNRRMMQEVRAALDERDLLLYIADATRPVTEQDAKAMDMVRKAATPSFLVLSKIDAVQDKRLLLPRIEQYREKYEFDDYIPVSAVTGEGLDVLTDAVVKRLPEGPAFFPTDQITDQPERFLAGEMIREKILRLTNQEVPHSVAVIVDTWEETKKLTRIAATIYAERSGQKAIIIGSQGAMLKEIGTRARQDIEGMLGKKVFLELFVKVRENWRESPEFLTQLDWRTMAGGDSE
jgi:GTP-binding protein Era